MTRLSDRETVLRLALLIEDRTPQEQQAMLREAAQIEAQRLGLWRRLARRLGWEFYDTYHGGEFRRVKR